MKLPAPFLLAFCCLSFLSSPLSWGQDEDVSTPSKTLKLREQPALGDLLAAGIEALTMEKPERKTRTAPPKRMVLPPQARPGERGLTLYGGPATLSLAGVDEETKLRWSVDSVRVHIPPAEVSVAPGYYPPVALARMESKVQGLRLFSENREVEDLEKLTELLEAITDSEPFTDWVEKRSWKYSSDFVKRFAHASGKLVLRVNRIAGVGENDEAAENARFTISLTFDW